ncbi:endonuclease Q family protein [Patescibacteria group bacterium]
MRYIADLHVHSRYSRACSKNLTLPNMAAWARAKGIDVLATADFTHPEWLKDIETQLEPAEDGLWRVRPDFDCQGGGKSYVPAPQAAGGRDARFILSTELCCIYKKNDRTRRLHLVVLAPNVAAVKKIVRRLENDGRNLKSDGRPILGMDAKEIVKMALDADADCEVIPAHAWTPWFSVFGSQSGFDSLEECFDELTPHIHAVETGLSSDPPMNWRLSGLDSLMLVSNSDAHGLRNLAREANVFELNSLGYGPLLSPIREHDTERFPYTIEFFPEEGKYHADGHRNCGFSCDPAKTARLGGKCPRCGKPLTRGVLGRVHELADRESAGRPEGAQDFRHIVPLEEIIADATGRTKAAKSVLTAYLTMVERLGPEFDILLDVPIADIEAVSSPKIAEGIGRVREGNVRAKPGYDGEFGAVRVFEDSETETQTALEL